MQIAEKDKIRFNAKVAPSDENGCMLWTASTDAYGYGRFGLNGNVVRAHRFAMYAAEIYPESDDLQVDHLCRVRSCQNADHLEWVTTAENSRRGNLGVHGNSKKGSEHYKAKLTEEDIPHIRDMLEEGFQIVEVAQRFDVSRYVIRDIKKGRTWKHV